MTLYSVGSKHIEHGLQRQNLRHLCSIKSFLNSVTDVTHHCCPCAKWPYIMGSDVLQCVTGKLLERGTLDLETDVPTSNLQT